MKERRIYLDTSAIVKRYLLEPGTEIVDSIYKDAHRREVLIGFSSWNIGEASVVFDKYERMGVINEARKVFEKFLLESRTLVLSGSLRILSIRLWEKRYEGELYGCLLGDTYLRGAA